MKRIGILFVAALLAACGSLPTTSGVTVVRDVAVNTGGDSVRVIVRPPRAEMSPTEVVEGFVAANASTSNNFAVARLYLLNDPSVRWLPTDIKLYDPASIVYTFTGQNTIQVRFDEIGQLPANHILELWEQPQPIYRQFNLSAGDDGVRIVNPPNFAMMTLTDLQRSYSSELVYFLNDQYEQLVPMSVWVPRDEGALATRLMRVLLAGPTKSEAGSLRTAIPEGTGLALAAVTTTDGVVSVTLNSTALRAGGSQRDAMLGQIVMTLADGNRSVEVKVGTQALDLAGSSPLTPYMFKRLDPTLAEDPAKVFGIADGRLLGGTFDELGQFRRLGSATSFSVSPDGMFVAFLRANRAWLAPTSGQGGEQALASGIRSLAFDATGRLWLVTERGSLLVKSSDSRLRSVNGLTGLDVVRLSPSPDGSRLALVLASRSGNRLRVVNVSSSGGEIGVGPTARLERFFADVTDVDWQSASELVVLGRAAVESPRVWALGLGSLQPIALGGPNTFIRVVAGNRQPPLGLTESGQVWVLASGQWRFATSLQAVDYAG